MKSIAVMGRRLISTFLMMVASSFLFLTFPAIAATSVVTYTPANFEAEVLKSDKPVIVIPLPINGDLIRDYDIPVEEFKAAVQKIGGDKYKIAIGDARYDGKLNLYYPLPLSLPQPIPFLIFEKGELKQPRFTFGFNTTQLVDRIKNQLP
jgi:hypothetical protein